MAEKITPARKAIDAWGGAVELAADLRMDAGAVRKWKSRNGLVPAKYHAQLLEIAKRKRLKFSMGDLIQE